MIQKIVSGKNLVAIIIKSNHKKEGIEFFTPGDFSQQLAYMEHPTGYKIKPHIHNLILREVKYTQEALFIRKGKVKVDFYTDEKKYLKSTILKTGDVILLAFGGHSFTMLEPTESEIS